MGVVYTTSYIPKFNTFAPVIRQTQGEPNVDTSDATSSLEITFFGWKLDLDGSPESTFLVDLFSRRSPGARWGTSIVTALSGQRDLLFADGGSSEAALSCP